MPTYEYRCLDCHRRFDVFLTYSEYESKTVHCTQCHSSRVQRKIGKVRVARSMESRINSAADSGSLEDMEKDPRALGKMMRELSAETGEDMGDTFNEVVSRLESGQDPESIEREIPELGADAEGGMGDLGGGFDD